MKKIIPLVLFLQVLLILFVFLAIKKRKNKWCCDSSRDESLSYYDPAYRKYFEKRWKKDAEKLVKEMKKDGTYYNK